ncbi:MAG: biopolymer transporter ExbD [Spirochaetes bacterium]|jgi:biopolymer transport protein ExbD|nr:biopolymer transporter ExbD [Spirochaetota bacterium]
MKIKSTQKSLLSIESVALTDIIMNLFIFFFISFSLLYTFNPYQESKIKVSLPKGVTNVQEADEGPIVVTVTAKNDIYIGNTLIPKETILDELKKYGSDARKKSVIVKADRQASVDYFVKVLDAAKQAGIDKLGVSIELQGNK